MNCERFHDQLLDLLSGNLETTEAKEMLEHSTRCPDCDAVLCLEESMQIERAEGIVANVPESWSNTMWPAVMAEFGTGQVPASSPRAMPMWGSARFAIAALLALLLVGTGYLLGQRVPSDDEPVPRLADVQVDESMNMPTSSKPAVADLLAALDRLPSDTTLVSSDEAQALLREGLVEARTRRMRQPGWTGWEPTIYSGRRAGAAFCDPPGLKEGATK